MNARLNLKRPVRDQIDGQDLIANHNRRKRKSKCAMKRLGDPEPMRV